MRLYWNQQYQNMEPKNKSKREMYMQWYQKHWNIEAESRGEEIEYNGSDDPGKLIWTERENEEV